MAADTMIEGAVSRLVGGMEIVAVPVTHPHDIRAMNIELARGRYAVVEWILSELDRNRDLDRVAGLKANPLPEGGVLFQLELRQPAMQIEEWLRKWMKEQGPNHRSALCFSFNGANVVAYEQGEGAESPIGTLHAEALSAEKFTDTNRPWWETDVPISEAARATNTGDNQDPPSTQGDEVPDHDGGTSAVREGAGG